MATYIPPSCDFLTCPRSPRAAPRRTFCDARGHPNESRVSPFLPVLPDLPVAWLTHLSPAALERLRRPPIGAVRHPRQIPRNTLRYAVTHLSPQPSSGSEAYLVALYGTYLAAQLLLALKALTWRPGKASGLLAVQEEGYLVGSLRVILHT